MPESNSAVVLFVSVKNWLTLRPLRLIIFSYKNTKRGSILSPLFVEYFVCIASVFCSYQASVICLPVATYFLLSLPCDDSTKAVNGQYQEPDDFEQILELLMFNWFRTD